MMYNYLRDKLLLFKSKKILGFLSFIESIFFPIPTDVLLIPMSMSKSYKWIDLAFLTTVTSVLGGVVGYFLGVFLFNEINPYIIEYGYLEEFNQSKNLFIEYGVIILFISSFTPLPYKIFVIINTPFNKIRCHLTCCPSIHIFGIIIFPFLVCLTSINVTTI